MQQDKEADSFDISLRINLNELARPVNTNTAQFLKALTRVKQHNFVDSNFEKSKLNLKSPHKPAPNRKNI